MLSACTVVKECRKEMQKEKKREKEKKATES